MLFFVQNPPRKGSRILDIGAGWGQFTLPLAKTNEVVALEPTAERLEFIQASAEQEGVQGNITYVQADYLDVRFEPVFDLILCIGVLEWVPRFRDGVPWELQMQFLRTARSQLAPGGRIVVGIENRFGLKYLLGSSDDHIGSPNIAVLHAELANARFKARTGTDLRSFTYTSSEYARLFKEAGFLSVKAYAAFPDYKIASLILPLDEHFDRALLGVTFPPEHDGSSGEPHLPEFQEALNSHYRSLADLGIARFFVPSFYFELRA